MERVKISDNPGLCCTTASRIGTSYPNHLSAASIWDSVAGVARDVAFACYNSRVIIMSMLDILLRKYRRVLGPESFVAKGLFSCFFSLCPSLCLE